MNNVAEQLRKLAAELREMSKKKKKTSVAKCAQIMTAAVGITRLKEAINGETKC